MYYLAPEVYVEAHKFPYWQNMFNVFFPLKHCNMPEYRDNLFIAAEIVHFSRVILPPPKMAIDKLYTYTITSTHKGQIIDPKPKGCKSKYNYEIAEVNGKKYRVKWFILSS